LHRGNDPWVRSVAPNASVHAADANPDAYREAVMTRYKADIGALTPVEKLLLRCGSEVSMVMLPDEPAHGVWGGTPFRALFRPELESFMWLWNDRIVHPEPVATTYCGVDSPIFTIRYLGVDLQFRREH
jgi:hypothetical protein